MSLEDIFKEWKANKQPCTKKVTYALLKKHFEYCRELKDDIHNIIIETRLARKSEYDLQNQLKLLQSKSTDHDDFHCYLLQSRQST